MILATARCGFCRTLSEYPTEDSETFLTCLVCGQKNAIAMRSQITGICVCGRAFDDHGWKHGGPVCPKRRRE